MMCPKCKASENSNFKLSSGGLRCRKCGTFIPISVESRDADALVYNRQQAIYEAHLAERQKRGK